MSEYLRASDGQGEAVRAIVTDDREIGSSSIVTDSVLNFPHKFIGTVGTVVDDRLDPETVTVFYGTLAGSIIEIDSYAPSYSDIGNFEGQVVLIKPTTSWADEVAEAVSDATDAVNNIPNDIASALEPIETTPTKVGIGKVPANGTLDVAGDIYQNNKKVLDTSSMIPSQNIDWANQSGVGHIILAGKLWQWFTINVTVNTAATSWSTAFPIPFAATPETYQVSIATGWISATTGGAENVTATGMSGFWSSTAGTRPRSGKVYVFAIGTPV